jgi:hypothetical protein
MGDPIVVKDRFSIASDKVGERGKTDLIIHLPLFHMYLLRSMDGHSDAY